MRNKELHYMPTSIFGNEQPAAQPVSVPPVADTPVAQPAPVQNPYGNHLAAIKNERGEVKYNTVEDALTGAAHAQVKITEDAASMQTLQQELLTAREENAQLKGALNVADLIKPKTPEPSQASSPAEPQGLSEAQTIELYKKLSVQQSEEATQTTNVASVVNKLKEKFGEKASEVFYSNAAKLNMTNDQMNQLAATSPTAALSLFDGVVVENLNPTQSSVNTTATPAPTTIDGPLPMGDKSMLVGASSQDVQAEMARHREAVYKQYGVTA